MMCMMKSAKVEITTIKISLKNKEKINKNHFLSKKEFIKFDGFLAVNKFLQKIKSKK